MAMNRLSIVTHEKVTGFRADADFEFLTPIARVKGQKTRVQGPRSPRHVSAPTSPTSRTKFNPSSEEFLSLHRITRQQNDRMDRLLKRVHHAETSARGGSVSPSRQKTTSDESFIAMSDNLEAVLSKYKEYRSNILSNGAPASSNHANPTPTSQPTFSPSKSSIFSPIGRHVPGSPQYNSVDKLTVRKSVSSRDVMSRVQAKIEAARQALEEGKAISPDARRSKGSPLSPYRTIDGECEDGNAMGRASFPMGKRNRVELKPMEFTARHEIATVISEKKEKLAAKLTSAKAKRQQIAEERKQEAISSSLLERHEQLKAQREDLERRQLWRTAYCNVLSYLVLGMRFRQSKQSLTSPPGERRLTFQNVVLAKVHALRMKRNKDAIREALLKFAAQTKMYQRANAVNLIVAFLKEATSLQQQFKMTLKVFRSVVRAQRFWRRKRMLFTSQLALLCMQWDAVEEGYLMESPMHGRKRFGADVSIDLDIDDPPEHAVPLALHGRRIPKRIRNAVLLDDLVSRRKFWYSYIRSLREQSITNGVSMTPPTFQVLLPRTQMRRLVETWVDKDLPTQRTPRS